MTLTNLLIIAIIISIIIGLIKKAFSIVKIDIIIFIIYLIYTFLMSHGIFI